MSLRDASVRLECREPWTADAETFDALIQDAFDQLGASDRGPVTFVVEAHCLAEMPD